ncbi:unnamed protein product [Allacma fusca]|uniref:Uncharacterized protein n=1 Tax=Allacma fusca TaxID=39272 RepID=A0A8J2P2B7_9HEXA|nr:unnamed protein product [Allacma fusca]
MEFILSYSGTGFKWKYNQGNVGAQVVGYPTSSRNSTLANCNNFFVSSHPWQDAQKTYSGSSDLLNCESCRTLLTFRWKEIISMFKKVNMDGLGSKEWCLKFLEFMTKRMWLSRISEAGYL